LLLVGREKLASLNCSGGWANGKLDNRGSLSSSLSSAIVAAACEACFWRGDRLCAAIEPMVDDELSACERFPLRLANIALLRSPF